MISKEKYEAWLADDSALPVVIFEAVARIGTTETTLYLANRGYTTGPTETPANTVYMPVVDGDVSVAMNISLSGEAALSWGDIELYNGDGGLDPWLTYVWRNRAINAWLGDVRWPRADFQPIFTGIIEDIDSKSSDRLNIKLRDKLQQLNTPVTDVKLGGDCSYTQNGTIVTVTKPAHGRRVGSPVQVHVNTGSASNGTFQITGAPSADTFTYSSVSPSVSAGSLTIVGTNEDALLPLAFGEVHNITPLLTDAATQEYQGHAGQVESIFEVRDNGVPVAAVTSNGTGKFNLTAAPAGAVTVSMQGDKHNGVYANTIAQLVRRLVTGYGKASQRFTDADIDTANFAAFDAAHPAPVNLYLPDRTNVLEACRQIAASAGAQLVVSAAGLLRLIQISLPPPGVSRPIMPSQIVDGTLELISRTEVTAAVKIGYCRNWTEQSSLQTSIPTRDKNLFAQQWLTRTSTDDTVLSDYRLNAEPEQEDTCFSVGSDAQNEVDRRLALRKRPHSTYRFQGTPDLLTLELGGAVTLYSDRYSLKEGGAGIVVGLTPTWNNRRAIVEVLI